MASTVTYFAPAERVSEGDVLETRERFLADPLAMTVLAALPDLVLVVNPQRQIVAYNQRLWEALGVESPEDLLGLRPGEIVHCIHAEEGPGGCGTAEACASCGAVHAILEALETDTDVTKEGSLRTAGTAEGGALDLRIHAVPVVVAGTRLVVLSLRDISDEKRRAVLQRVFFHDVANTAMSILALSELMGRPGGQGRSDEEYRADLRRLSHQIMEEITSQRQLLAAERGDLTATLSSVPASAVWEGVLSFYRHHELSHGRQLPLPAGAPDTTVVTDAALLRRTLGNLVKNALEATPAGGTVTVGAEERGQEIAFWVHNPTVMAEEVQQQLFHRSYSTHPGPGRGIGLHSVKLITERYLGGRVTFSSTEPEGTTFTVTLPQAP